VNSSSKKMGSPHVELFPNDLNQVRHLLATSSQAGGFPSKAGSALQSALSNQGKLFRSQFVLGLAHLFDKSVDGFIHRIAASVEMVHTASLILDDLPCMDDALLRRGKPPLHRQFGEGHTILAAFAIISRANQLLATPHTRMNLSRQLQVLEIFNRSFGLDGLAGGQSLDLETSTSTPLPEFATIHHYKTGALFTACAQMVAIWCQISLAQKEKVMVFARNLGLAFQVTDDLLDLQSATETAKCDEPGPHHGSLATRLSRTQMLDRLRTYHHAAWVALTGFGMSAVPLKSQVDSLLTLASDLACPASR